MDHLKQIKKQYPEYYKNKVNFLCTLHPFHEYKKIDEFYLNDMDYFGKDKVRAYFVNKLLLKENIKKVLMEKSIRQSSILNKILQKGRLDSDLRYKIMDYDTKFTEMCFPGESKLFVDVNGFFHVCEKVRLNLPIGNIDKGFDYDMIRYIYREWSNEIIRHRCWECPVWSFCGVCLSQSDDENGVKVECDYKNQGTQILKEYVSFKEEEDKKEDKNMRYKTVMDYIRQL